MTGERDEILDELRAALAIEPSAGFAGRVRRAVEARGARRTPWLIVAAACGAVILAAVAVEVGPTGDGATQSRAANLTVPARGSGAHVLSEAGRPVRATSAGEPGDATTDRPVSSLVRHEAGAAATAISATTGRASGRAPAGSGPERALIPARAAGDFARLVAAVRRGTVPASAIPDLDVRFDPVAPAPLEPPAPIEIEPLAVSATGPAASAGS
jgi:hypothetical protein